DGVPKDGKQYPNVAQGGHEPYENFGPDCMICGLPQEAMQKRKPGKTVVVGSGSSKPQWFIPAILGGLILLLGVGAFGLYQFLSGRHNEGETPTTSETTPSGGLVSETAQNAQSISQGEKILLDSSPQKQAGATAFAQKDWDGAIAAYQQAATSNPNDPEAKIYLNNARARKVGNPLTIAVVVPIASNPDSAKEVLRGVASYQEQFNRSVSGRLLEVVIANDTGQSQASSLAQDIINAPDVLGILGHGIDTGGQQALKKYGDAGLAALSPLTTSAAAGTLKTIPIGQKTNELLLGNYLQAVSKTLVKYANQKHSPPAIVIFFNSDSPYSQQLKQELVNALPQVKGKLVKEIDITTSGFNADAEITNAKQNGANVALLALSKNKVPQAIAIAQANNQAGSPLLLMGGDDLYSADILVQGGNAIQGIVLAVPWSFKPDDPFAKDAVKSWKGRVSWRTTTAYDATKVLADTISQNPSRSGVVQQLQQGVPLKGNTDFNIFNEVPLVEAVPGTNGPPGAKYEFASVKL
ncbi:MAG: ABC transporter substrate-binding protein, partial [Microcystaceae cyanobacterium]